MKHVLHIAAKDVRRMRWLLIGWALIVAVSAALAIVQARLDYETGASSRIVGDPHSSLVDLPLTAVQEGTLLSMAAWYDTEIGSSTSLAKTAAHIAG